MTELRTRSMDQAIVSARMTGNSRQIVVVYEPGNGTRYTVLFCTPLGPAVEDIGLDRNSCVVTLMMGAAPWRSAPFVMGGGFLTHDYVMEKLELNESDGRVLTELIARLLGRTCELAGPPEEHTGADFRILFLMPQQKE